MSLNTINEKIWSVLNLSQFIYLWEDAMAKYCLKISDFEFPTYVAYMRLMSWGFT